VVYAGPRCALAEQATLQLWVPSDEPLRAELVRGRSELKATSEPMLGGRRYRVELPRGAAALRLLRDNGQVVFELALQPAHIAPVIQDAKRLRANGQFAEARQLLQAALPTLDAEAGDRAHALLARIAIAEGDDRAAVAGLRASLERDYATGRLSDAAHDATALAYILCRNLRDYVAARAVLERAVRSTTQDPSARALLGHYLGVLAFETGDLGRALQHFRTAAQQLARLGLREHELVSRQEYAFALSVLGRQAEAVAAQELVVAESARENVCLQVDRQEAVTRFALSARPRSGSDLVNTALRSVAETERLLAACPSPWRQRSHAINAALLALELGDLTRAQQRLAELPVAPLAGNLTLTTLEREARGRLLFATGQLDLALQAFEDALTFAKGAELRDVELSAWLGIARVNARLGRAERAIESYAAAEAVLDEQLDLVPLSEGQGGFQHARDAGTRELTELLVSLGRNEQALTVARHSRARILRALSRGLRLTQLDSQQRARWESAVTRYREQRAALENARVGAWRLPTDVMPKHNALLEARRAELRAALDEASALLQRGASSAAPAPLALAPGEVLLAYFAVDGGVRSFAVTTQSLHTVAIAQLSSGATAAQLSAILLEPFREELRSASRVRVIAHAPLAAIDVHALELDGSPLGLRVPVVYSLDVPTSELGRVASSAALVVADPTEDLPWAVPEARVVEQLLRDAYPEIDVYLKRNALRTRVVDRLSALDLFHFAGHARYAGIEGIDSSFLLSDGEITVGDILSLSRAPRRVVLSACEGARSDGVGMTAGIGLAQAFVASGSQEVVATARPIHDELAKRFFPLFYAALRGDPRADGAQALRHAAAQLREDSSRDDWSAFRMLTP